MGLRGLRLGKQNVAEKPRSLLFILFYIYLKIQAPLNPGLCGWRFGLLVAPSTVVAFCRNSHTSASTDLQGRTRNQENS